MEASLRNLATAEVGGGACWGKSHEKARDRAEQGGVSHRGTVAGLGQCVLDSPLPTPPPRQTRQTSACRVAVDTGRLWTEERGQREAGSREATLATGRESAVTPFGLRAGGADRGFPQGQGRRGARTAPLEGSPLRASQAKLQTPGGGFWNPECGCGVKSRESPGHQKVGHASHSRAPTLRGCHPILSCLS